MNFTFRQLRLFLALAETGSVSAAAKEMHVTQPTASMQLKEISASVGLPLYEVIGKKVFLTDVGKSLAVTAREITQSLASFEQLTYATKEVTKGHLRITVVSTAKYFMPRLIGSFCKRHPLIDVSLEILNRDGVLGRLRQNTDDLYIMSMPPDDVALMDKVLMPNPIVVIAASSDVLARQSKVSLSDLKDRRFILREKGSGTRMAADQYFQKKKFRADIRLELGSNEAVKESVAGGLGIGVISQYALHGHQKEHGVRVIQVDDFPLKSSWHLVYLAAKNLSPIALAFKDHIIQEINGK
ncbi:LysR substrate-binding domain-containing protein [Limnohabitans sp.]|uniref:LysR family transcriptional regulator n=1 Tax=Limnohabitans sp. TaxID=1907725 RepID=UPI00286EFE58|nr:LysR substrate-binding domain-containing protein [Limnohabitans sp.]